MRLDTSGPIFRAAISEKSNIGITAMGRHSKDKSFEDLKRTLEESKKVIQDNIIDQPERKSRKARRKEQRSYDLPKDRRCPDCGKLKLKSRQWVVVEDEDIKTCLSCYRKYYV